MTPIPEDRVASRALWSREGGLEHAALLRPFRPLGARHLPNHKSTRGDLLADVLELRPALRGCSLLHIPHQHSLVGAMHPTAATSSSDGRVLQRPPDAAARQLAAHLPLGVLGAGVWGLSGGRGSHSLRISARGLCSR